ncbi:MAG: polyphosphate polymerase domain-containing protein [Verrucomicrobia bacterium]|nr:polyphosphate polymerase domain-containing protein [Verrucomicrobiota bacterium]
MVVSPSLITDRRREPACELKFLVPRALAQEIGHWACEHLNPDPYADPAQGNAYSITSLYFDTPEFHVLRRLGSFARSKYRVRRYDHHRSIFLERKLKTNGRVSKRRTPTTIQELDRLGEDDADRGWGGYWFHRRLLFRGLRPMCQIRYRRAAWVRNSAESLLRLTLDENLETAAISGVAFDDTSAGQRLLADQAVLELKFRSQLPALFKCLIQEFALQPQPVSKYRVAAAALGRLPYARGEDSSIDHEPETPAPGRDAFGRFPDLRALPAQSITPEVDRALRNENGRERRFEPPDVGGFGSRLACATDLA